MKVMIGRIVVFHQKDILEVVEMEEEEGVYYTDTVP
jgi:hypothetical protein